MKYIDLILAGMSLFLPVYRNEIVQKTRSKQDPEFSERLRDLREERSLNIAELAKLVKVSPAAIWHWENKGTMPRRTTFDEIAKVLGVSRSFLQTGKQSNGESHGTAVRETKTSIAELSLEELIRAIEAKGFEVSIKSRS